MKTHLAINVTQEEVAKALTLTPELGNEGFPDYSLVDASLF